VKIYSVADGSLLHEIKKHTDWIYSLEFSPDGALLATADRGGGMFVWEAETAREYQNLKGHTAAITSLSWRVDGNLLASASEDGTIKLWEMEAGAQVKNWAAHGGGAAAVSFTHDGRLVSAGRDRLVKIWDANGAQQRAFDALPDLALQSVFTHNGARVVGGDWSGEVRMWKRPTASWSPACPPIRPRSKWSPRPSGEKAAATKAAAERPPRISPQCKNADRKAAALCVSGRQAQSPQTGS
jgi:WD40 repeat protein